MKTPTLTPSSDLFVLDFTSKITVGIFSHNSHLPLPAQKQCWQTCCTMTALLASSCWTTWRIYCYASSGISRDESGAEKFYVFVGPHLSNCLKLLHSPADSGLWLCAAVFSECYTLTKAVCCPKMLADFICLIKEFTGLSWSKMFYKLKCWP